MTQANGFNNTLPFEQPAVDLEQQIFALEKRTDADTLADELEALRSSRNSILAKLYANLHRPIRGWWLDRIAILRKG